MRLRKIHFVIHNQGPYACVKKDELLMLLQNKYGTSLEGYLICQEMYKHQPDDSHLQGNLFFKNALQHTALLKVLKAKYTPIGQESLGRVDLSPVLHEGRAYNYMINSAKEGGDPKPISDMTAIDFRKKEQAFSRELCELLCETYKLCHKKAWDTKVWPDEYYTPSDFVYIPPEIKPKDFIFWN